MCIRDRQEAPAMIEERGLGKKTVNYKPVSYTHLDVYKRQEKDCIYYLRENLHKLTEEVTIMADYLIDGENFGDEAVSSASPRTMSSARCV